MPDDTQLRRERADRLRKQIDEAKSQTKPESEDPEEMKPGESPKEYVERRSRNVSRKKREKA